MQSGNIALSLAGHDRPSALLVASSSHGCVVDADRGLNVVHRLRGLIGRTGGHLRGGREYWREGRIIDAAVCVIAFRVCPLGIDLTLGVSDGLPVNDSWRRLLALDLLRYFRLPEVQESLWLLRVADNALEIGLPIDEILFTWDENERDQ